MASLTDDQDMKQLKDCLLEKRETETANGTCKAGRWGVEIPELGSRPESVLLQEQKENGEVIDFLCDWRGRIHSQELPVGEEDGDLLRLRKRVLRQQHEEEHLTAEKLILSRFQRTDGDQPSRQRSLPEPSDGDEPGSQDREHAISVSKRDSSISRGENSPWLSPDSVHEVASSGSSSVPSRGEATAGAVAVSTPPASHQVIFFEKHADEASSRTVRALVSGPTTKNIKSSALPSPLRRKPLKVLSIFHGSCQRVEFGTSELLRIVHSHRPPMEEDIRSGLLRLRDLRQILSSGPASQRPSIEPRRSCILVNMPAIKALILRNRVFLIARPPPEAILKTEQNSAPESERSRIPLFSRKSRADLRKMLAMHRTSSASAKEVYSDDIASPAIVQKLVKLSELQAVPFEFLALEAILFEVTSRMSDALDPMQELADRLQDAKSHTLSSTTALHEIRDAKRFLQEIEGHAKGLARSLEEILENEEDVRRLEISRFWQKPEEWDAPEDSPGAEDVEILLESYQQDVESMLLKIETMDETLDTILQLMQLHLATTRNILLKFEIGLQVIGVAIALVAAIAGIFGMNIPNGYETDSNAFWTLSYLMTILITVTGVGVGAAIFRLKL